MEISWLRIKNGFLLQHLRRSIGQMLVLSDGGRVDVKDQTGTGPAVMQNNAEVGDFNYQGEIRLANVSEVGAGAIDYAGTAGQGIDATGVNLLTLAPPNNNEDFYRVLDGADEQIIYIINNGAVNANVFDDHGNDLLDVDDGYMNYIAFRGGRWYGHN